MKNTSGSQAKKRRKWKIFGTTKMTGCAMITTREFAQIIA
jgi:hypothetical protein